MAANVIPKEAKVDPDQSVLLQPGDLDAIEFQDCANIIRAYEQGSHMSSSEGSIFAPISKQKQVTKAFVQAQQEVLQSWFETPNTADSGDSPTRLKGLGIQQVDDFTAIKDDDFGDALKNIYEGCVPCDSRLDIQGLFRPSIDFIAMLENDVSLKIKFLTDLDGLLSDVNAYGDICRLLGLLNFMCIPDLQRMISVLMGLLMKSNLSLDGQFQLVASLIVPIFTPLVSGLTNLLSQYEALVLDPIACVIISIQNEIGNLAIDVGPFDNTEVIGGVTEQLDDPLVAARTGLALLRDQLIEGDALIRGKLRFYLDQLDKMLGDWNGGSISYLTDGLAKLL